MKVIFSTCISGNGHQTQAIALKQFLQEKGINVCCNLTGKPFNKNLPEYFTKEFNNDYNLYNRKALPASSLLYTWGNSYSIKKNVLGILASASYNNSNKFTQVTQTKYRYDDNIVDQKLTDKQSNSNINVGAILNFGYKVGQKIFLVLKTYLIKQQKIQQQLDQG